MSFHAFSSCRSRRGQRLRYNEFHAKFHTNIAGLSQAFEISATATAFCKEVCQEAYKAAKSTSVSRLVFVLLQISVHIGNALNVLGSAVGNAILNGGVTDLSGEANAAVAVARKTPNISSLIIVVYTNIWSFFLYLEEIL